MKSFLIHCGVTSQPGSRGVVSQTVGCAHILGVPVGSRVRDPSVGQWQDNIREFFYMEELMV